MSAGGDVAVRGLPATGVWSIAVDESITLGLTEGGVATSGRDRRRWRRGGKELHHLIDPRTGAPAETDLLRVTAVGDDAVAAEVLAKYCSWPASERPQVSTVPAVLVTADGRTRFVAGCGGRHHDPTFWLLARSAGLSAYVLLTLSVLAGLTLRSRPSPRLRAPPLVAELHKTLAVSGLAALALHGVALVLDSTVKVTPAALVSPGPRLLPAGFPSRSA